MDLEVRVEALREQPDVPKAARHIGNCVGYLTRTSFFTEQFTGKIMFNASSNMKRKGLHKLKHLVEVACCCNHIQRGLDSSQKPVNNGSSMDKEN